MRFLVRFDEFLVAAFERFSHWFQHQTGKTNFFLARIAIALVAFTLVTGVVVKIVEAKTFRTIWSVDYFEIAGFFALVLWRYDSEEYDAVRRLAEGFKNPLKIHPAWRWFRSISTAALLILQTTLVGFALLNLFLDGETHGHDLPWYIQLWDIAIISWLYLESCDPLPPCSGKIVDTFQRWFGKTVSAEQER